MINKILVFNVRDTPYETFLRKDIENACKDFYDVHFLDSRTCWLSVSTGKVQLFSVGGEIEINNAFVFIRSRKIDSSFVSLLCHMCHLLRVSFTDIGNMYHSDFLDKSFAVPRLALHDIPVPNSIIVSRWVLKRHIDSIEEYFSYPCIAKGDGARGDQVTVVQNRENLISFLGAAEEDHKLITLQAIIENAYDIRALFFKQMCLGVIRRTRKSDELFLNNVSKGADVAADSLSVRELFFCKKAMRIGYLDFCGIDFIRTSKGPVFLELNKTPQIGGVQKSIPNFSVGSALFDSVRKMSWWNKYKKGNTHRRKN
jgi:hypothetical protein